VYFIDTGRITKHKIGNLTQHWRRGRWLRKRNAAHNATRPVLCTVSD